MAYPIEETPELEGHYAEQFLSELNAPKVDSAKEKFLKECSELFHKNQDKK